ncbi:MAG: septum formation initiator family protein [candidate division NC10 bacterium]|nr:septum formation initiator family protein [candidate division NC10 bacterium]
MMGRWSEEEAEAGSRWGGRRRRILLLAGGVLLGLLLVSLSGDGSLIRLYRSTRQQSALRQEIERLKDENARLRREVEALQHDETRLEEIARLKLGLVRPGEVVYRFLGPARSDAGRGGGPDRR